MDHLTQLGQLDRPRTVEIRERNTKLWATNTVKLFLAFPFEKLFKVYYF